MKIESKTCLKIGVTIFLLYLLIYYWPGIVGVLRLLFSAAFPLLLGCVIAYIVNILMSFYENKLFINVKKSVLVKGKRPLCMLLAFGTVTAMVFLLAWLVIPELVSCVRLLISKLPGAIEAAFVWIEEMGLLSEEVTNSVSAIDWESKVNDIMKALTTGLGTVADVVITTVISVFSGLVSCLLALIFSIYLLLGKENLHRQFKKVSVHYLKKEMYEKLAYVVDVCDDSFHKYIVGQCTEAVVLGGLCALGMLMLRLPYATMIGALIGFTALIPVAGAYIGAFVGAFMIFTVSPVQALIFLIFVVVLQQIEGNLIYPKVVGSSLGLPAIWVLAAVTVGGGIMGIAGMLLGVPLTAAVYRLLRDDVNRV